MDSFAPSTIGGVLRSGSSALRDRGIAGGELDARLLLAGIMKMDGATLLARNEEVLDEPTIERFRASLRRRFEGEPVHRILGRRFFYEHDFELSSETLEPRPDTEIVVEMALDILKSSEPRHSLNFVDVGTGSGVIALSLLAAVPHARAVGTDISADALRTAAANARSIGVADRFEPVLGSYFADRPGPWDLIVSNPPYIRTGDIERLPDEVRRFDPRAALDGGEDGLEAYRAIAARARSLLSSGGSIVVEIGFDQRGDVVDVFHASEWTFVAERHDLGGNIRALCFE